MGRRVVCHLFRARASQLTQDDMYSSRSMLETPKKVFTVGSRFDSQQFYEPAAAPMHATTAAAGANQYSYALNSAEVRAPRQARVIACKCCSVTAWHVPLYTCGR